MNLKFIPLTVVALLLIAAGALYFKNLNSNNVVEGDIIVETVSQKLPQQNVSNPEIIYLNEGHARMSFINSETGESSEVFLVKNNDRWVVVDVNQSGIFFCEKMEKFNFPPDFISDCTLEYASAIRPGDLINKKANNTNNSGGSADQSEELQVVGFIDFGDDPSSGSFNLGSGYDDETVEIDYSDIVDSYTSDNNPNQGLEDGDQVIVTVVIEEDEDGEPVAKAKEVEEINELDIEDYEQNPQADNNDSDNEDTEQVIYDITDYPPDAAPPPEFFLNLFDIDNSYREIEIIGN